jgi:hypothetical protein
MNLIGVGVRSVDWGNLSEESDMHIAYEAKLGPSASLNDVENRLDPCSDEKEATIQMHTVA